MAGPTTQPMFRVVDDPTIHEIYANQFISGSYDGRSVTLTFGTTRPLPERMGEGNSEDVGLQVYVFEMTPAAATDMIKSIERHAEEQRRHPRRAARRWRLVRWRQWRRHWWWRGYLGPLGPKV